MDKIKREILEQISANSRLSTADLAKKLKKQRHVVAYHRDQLVKNKTIVKHELGINYKVLGLKEYVVYIKFFQYRKIKEDFTKYLKQHQNVRWAAETFPKFNVRIGVIAKDEQDFESFVDEIENKFGNHMLQKEMLIVRDVLKYETYSRIGKQQKSDSTIKLKQDERKLLCALFDSPAEPLLKLSQKSGFSIEGVRKKMKQFEEAGLVKGYFAKLDMTKLDISFWTVLMINIKQMESNHSKLRSLLYSDVCFGKTRRTFGPWNIEMTVFVEKYNKLSDIIHRFEETFGDDFEGFELQVYTDHLVQNRIPKKFV